MIPTWVQIAFSGADPELCYRTLRSVIEIGQRKEEPMHHVLPRIPSFSSVGATIPPVRKASATEASVWEGHSWVRLDPATHDKRTASTSPPKETSSEEWETPEPPQAEREPSPRRQSSEESALPGSSPPTSLFRGEPSFPYPPTAAAEESPAQEVALPRGGDWDHVSKEEVDELVRSSQDGSSRNLHSKPPSSQAFGSKQGSSQVFGSKPESIQSIGRRSNSFSA